MQDFCPSTVVLVSCLPTLSLRADGEAAALVSSLIGGRVGLGGGVWVSGSGA